jgi:hypothetical protein
MLPVIAVVAFFLLGERRCGGPQALPQPRSLHARASLPRLGRRVASCPSLGLGRALPPALRLPPAALPPPAVAGPWPGCPRRGGFHKLPERLHCISTFPATLPCLAAAGIEEIGVFIEEPFSILPLEGICRGIEDSVRVMAATNSARQGSPAAGPPSPPRPRPTRRRRCQSSCSGGRGATTSTGGNELSSPANVGGTLCLPAHIMAPPARVFNLWHLAIFRTPPAQPDATHKQPLHFNFVFLVARRLARCPRPPRTLAVLPCAAAAAPSAPSLLPLHPCPLPQSRNPWCHPWPSRRSLYSLPSPLSTCPLPLCAAAIAVPTLLPAWVLPALNSTPTCNCHLPLRTNRCGSLFRDPAIDNA